MKKKKLKRNDTHVSFNENLERKSIKSAINENNNEIYFSNSIQCVKSNDNVNMDKSIFKIT